MTPGESRARRIESECYDLAALEAELELPVPPPSERAMAVAEFLAAELPADQRTVRYTIERKCTRDDSFAAAIAQWNNTVAPWARGERA